MNFFNKVLLLTFVVCSTSVYSQNINYRQYFDTAALRLDYIHSGTNTGEEVSYVRFVKDSRWAGNPDNLIDGFGYGKYRVSVYSLPDKKEIFSYGFCTLFEEWQTTDEALKVKKAFEESIIIPYPNNEVLIELRSRNRDNSFQLIFSIQFKPGDETEIVNPVIADVKNFKISGDVSHNVDIAIIAEGYTISEKDLFQTDATFLINYLLSDPAFKKQQNQFNIRYVFPVSAESGTDIPGEDIWVNTALDSRFYTFGSDRYLTTDSYHKLRDVVSNVPCDQIIILVNSNKYGGGGIYNFYSVSSSSNLQSGEVLVHEFGHSFAALGDEYYTSETSYNDYYDLSHEPYQANLTTLVNFDVKWKNMIEKGVPVPTPDEPKYLNKTGVFEGGGYVAKGIYRPMLNCKMKELSAPFCSVCSKGIDDMIKYYCEPLKKSN